MTIHFLHLFEVYSESVQQSVSHITLMEKNEHITLKFNLIEAPRRQKNVPDTPLNREASVKKKKVWNVIRGVGSKMKGAAGPAHPTNPCN